MEPFEECQTEEEVDEKLEDMQNNGRDIGIHIGQATRRKLQIQSREGW